MESPLANAIEIFTKYQIAKLTNEFIDIQEFAYSEQQKRADFVDERNLPNNVKIDIESILDDLATVQKTTSEYEQRPWERDIVLRVQRMGAFTTSASTHLYKSRVKMKERTCEKGGGRTCREREKQCKWNDDGLKTGNKKGKERDHVMRREIYDNRVMKKYEKRQRSTLYKEDKEGHVKVDTRHSAARHSQSRICVTQYDEAAGSKRKREELVAKAEAKEILRHCVQVRSDYIGGGTGKDPNSSSKQQMVRSTQDRRSMAKAQAYPEDGKKISGMTAQKSRLESALGAEANHSTGKAKVASEDCSREGKKALVKVATETTERKVIEQLRKGKRKRVAWETKPTEDTNNGAKECSETTAKHMNEVAGTDKMCNDKHRQAKAGTEGTMKTSTSNGPMDKYLKGKGSVTRPPHTQSETPGTSSKRERIVDPKNPRRRPNRRTRRLHLQLHKVQAQPTLNWYGFRREIEEKQIHSADFAEEITYAMMESLYKVEDFTIIGVNRDNATDTGTQATMERLAEGVRIVSLNIRTLTKHKLPILAWYMQKYEVDCLMLQDVGCTELELRYHRVELKSLLGEETVITISPAGQQGGDEGQVGGLMTVVQTRLGLRFSNHKMDKLNLGLTQTTSCTINGQTLHLINTYWPVENKEGPNSLWNTTIREMRKRDIRGTPLQYVQDTILRERDKLVIETPGSLVLIGGDLNSTIRKEERGGRATPLDKWIIDAKLVSVRECLTGDDTEARRIENWATHYVGLEPRSIIDHFMLHGNGWEDQITGYGVDQNLEFSNYTDHRPIMCVVAVGPKLGKGTEDKRERRPWAPVIKHKDLVERFQKKMDRWHTKNATHLGTLQVEERYTEVVKAIRELGIPLANKSRKRLEEKRAAYKHGWSPEFIATKAKLDFLLEVRRILRRKDLCEASILEHIREAACNWERTVKHHMHDAEDQGKLLGGDHGLRYWRTATLLQVTSRYIKEYEEVKKMLHGKRREAMRMEMGGHIQRREERRAEGKLKKVIDSILKKARVNMDLSCFIDAEGVLQSDLAQGHIKLTQDFAAWYKTPLGHVDNEALFTKPWETICHGRQEYMNNLAGTSIPNDVQELFWEALMHTPRRGEISIKIQEALAHPPTYEDFTSALQSTKDSSAPGPSNVTYGLIKQLPPVILQEVYQLLCEIWEGRLTPEEWKLKWQQPIPKKVDIGTGICRVEDFRPLGLVDTFRKLWSKIIIRRIQMVWETAGVARSEQEEDHIQPAQHGFRAHRGTDTALSQLVNAMEQAEQMDTTIGVSSFDIRRAFDSVSKGLIHLGWVRLGVPEDVVRWLQAMDEDALTIVRTPFALEIHNKEGLDGLWKAIREGTLASFMAERGTAQGDVTSPATWMCIFDILLTMLDLAKLTHRFYIRHGSELSPVKPIAYADDLVAIMADVSGLQQVSRVVSGFCVICNLTILPAKLRTYYHNFGATESEADRVLITYHGKQWSPAETTVRGHILEDGPLKYLGVLANINNSYDDLYQALEGRVAQHCGLVNRARASGVTKATVAQASVLRSIEYAAVWANWSLEKYRKLDGLFTELLKTAARNMRSHPALALYMSRETMGQGFLRFSDEVQFRKWTFLQRAAMGHKDIRHTGQSLLDHVAARVQVDTVTGRSRYIVRQHRDVTEVWGGSLMEWLKEAGYGIYVHGARVETGSNEPIHDGMMRLEQSVRHFLETYNIQVWGDLVGFDAENKPRWKTPSEVPEKLRELMSRKTPPENGLHLRAGQYWCVKSVGAESWTIVEIMGADADKSYLIHCRYWQTLDMSRLPELEEVIYPMENLYGAGTGTAISWDQIFTSTECRQLITGDDVICGDLLTRPIQQVLCKPPPQAVWIRPLPPPATEQRLRHWMQKEEYCISGMNKKRAADCILLRDNPKMSRCTIATVTTTERQRPEHAIRITATSGEDVSNQDMEILGACLVIRFHQGTNTSINCSMKTTGQYLSQRQQIKKGKRNALTAMMEGWLPAIARVVWTPALKGNISPWKKQMTDKGMHIVRHMADGGTIRSCNTLEMDMQDVLMQLLQPGQPMLIQADKGTLVLGNLHQIMDDHRQRQYQITRDNYAEKAGRRRKFTDANFRLASKLHQLPTLTMQRAATVIRLALQKRWQGENLVKGGRTPTEPRSQWYCDDCDCVDSQEHWLTQCRRGKLAKIREDCLCRIKELGALYPRQIRKGIQAIQEYLCGGLDCGMLWTGIILRHHLVKFRRFTTQMEISYEQQGKWEEAIVTILAHTVHASWTMLAEHERLINTGGGDTGHHGLRPGSPPRLQENGTVHEATWMDKYLSRAGNMTTQNSRKRTRTPCSKQQERVAQQNQTIGTREDTVPLCPEHRKDAPTLEDEQTFVRMHYGDDFICAGDTWTERTAMRLCTGHWYSTYNIAAVVETLENQQAPDHMYCITRWELEKWTEGRRLCRRTLTQLRQATFVNYVVNHDNTHWGLLIAMRSEQTIDIIYADSLSWPGREWKERFKRWWTQVGRQEQTILQLVEHNMQLPQQEDTVECGVFTTCYHQVVFELSQQELWRNQDRETRLTQLQEALSRITATVAAQKRRLTRETLYLHGHRISTRVEEQMGQLLTDIAKKPEPTTQHLLRRGRKRKVETNGGEVKDNLKRQQTEATKEEREDELRQGRRVYEIQGTRQAGYNITLRGSHKLGAGMIRITEPDEIQSHGNWDLDEHTPNGHANMEGEQDFWGALVDYWAGSPQDVEQEDNTDTAIDLTQEDTTEPTAGTLETTPSQTFNQDSTTAQTEKVTEDKTPREEETHTWPVEGQEESKEEQVPTVVGKKRIRRRRSQLDDLITGAPSAPLGKRSRSAVDYTQTLDKEETKVTAKEIRTLPGARHQQWRVGYARSTINKVLAPGQDAGYGLFATSRIECNEIICTYEGASVDYDEAISNQYRSHYLMTCPTTRRAVDAAEFNSCYGRFACDPLDKALYNAICWSHTTPMILRAIAVIDTCYEVFWFYGDSFPWPSELLQLRARQMVIEQGWTIQDAAEDEDEATEVANPLDISGQLGTDFVLLPITEMRHTYQDPDMSTEQLHAWSDTATYANTAGPRQVMEANKGKKRRKPETINDTPTMQSPTDARAWASQMTARLRKQLIGPWIRIPTETQKRWPVAFASDSDALEARIGVVVTKDVGRYDIICDWEGTSTQGAAPLLAYDPEQIYDVQTATSLRLDGLSYGPWIGDTLRFDQYNAVHVWLPELLRYVTVILFDLPAGTGVYAPKGYLHWQHHDTKAREAKQLYQTPELDLRTMEEALRTANLAAKFQSNRGPIDDIGMITLAWTMSQLQTEEVSQYNNATHLEEYDWERLLRWRGRGPETPGVIISTPRIVSLTDAWIWLLCYPPCDKDPYRHWGWILELPMRFGTSPIGIGLDEHEEICACFATDVHCGTVLEQLDGDCLNSSQSDLDTYHPYQYPDINLGLTLDVTTPGSCLLRYAQDTKQWNRYNACYIYRQNQLHLITIRDVEKGEKLILPKGAAHWQGHEDGLIYEHGYTAEHQEGGHTIKIAERFKAIRDYKLEMGMDSALATYEDWTTRLKGHLRTTGELSSECINFDMKCYMYFRIEKGQGFYIEGSQGVYDVDKEEQQDFPPFGPD